MRIVTFAGSMSKRRGTSRNPHGKRACAGAVKILGRFGGTGEARHYETAMSGIEGRAMTQKALKSFKVYFEEGEYERVVRIAGDEPLSRFCRKIVLKALNEAARPPAPKGKT